MPSSQHPCPACGYDLRFRPWTGDSASDEICPSCGIQFGYDDAAGGDPNGRPAIYSEWRRAWIRDGMKWQGRGIAEPAGWDPSLQLIRAGLS